MSDVDSLLRERLDAAAAFAVETDPERVRADVARRQRRIRRRRRGSVLVGVLAVAVLAAGVVRLIDDGSGDDPDVRSSDASTAPPTPAPDGAGAFPSFRAAPGWETVQMGGGATAANVALGPASRAGNVPWDTVGALENGDVVLFGMFSPATEVSAAGGYFPPRDLPLSLDDAEPGGLEGQPEGVYAERLAAEVDGWTIDVIAFYGGESEPTAATRAAAQAQLDRLVVPARPAPGLNRTAAAGTCRPSDLVAEAGPVLGQAVGSIAVSASTRVDLPWSTCPAVATTRTAAIP